MSLLGQSAASRSPSTRSTTHPTSRTQRARALFSGRSTVETSTAPPQSPKSPLALDLNGSSSFSFPSQTTTTSSPHSSNILPGNAPVPEIIITSQPTTPNSQQRQPQQPDASAVPLGSRPTSAHRFVDPADQHLADLVTEGRRRKNKTEVVERRCVPNITNKEIRARIVGSLISGLVLLITLGIFLALTLAPGSVSSEFRVLLVLILLVASVVFCYSLIRLCLAIVRPPKEEDLEVQLPRLVIAGGYANPATPIRVALTRDEEAVGVQSEATKFPPPAYGLWRESVRVDPNRLFWQRNEAAALERQNSRTARPQSANRPPSYISEEGVDYVIDAQPRLTIPTSNVRPSPPYMQTQPDLTPDEPLPPHPSEARRWPAT